MIARCFKAAGTTDSSTCTLRLTRCPCPIQGPQTNSDRRVERRFNCLSNITCYEDPYVQHDMLNAVYMQHLQFDGVLQIRHATVWFVTQLLTARPVDQVSPRTLVAARQSCATAHT